jgi:hypothetical protein
MKYVYYDSVITDLKAKGVNSKYYSIVKPFDLIHLNNECFDFITTLYNLNEKGDLNKTNFYLRGNNIEDERIKFYAESFEEIFNDENKLNKLLDELAGFDFGDNAHLDFPICINQKYAIIKVTGSFRSATYYAALLKNAIYFTFLTGIMK